MSSTDPSRGQGSFSEELGKFSENSTEELTRERDENEKHSGQRKEHLQRF